MTETPPPTLLNPSHVKDSDVYRTLVDMVIHQDEISWGRVQALGVVELATLSAAYTLGGRLALVLLGFGSLIVLLIWQLIRRDWECRDYFFKALDLVHKPRRIRLIPKPINTLSGSDIMAYIMLLIFAFNLMFFTLELFCPCALKKSTESSNQTALKP